ncbi:hypothetical protein PAPYR_7007 [Paratrimastix pyriformis]|uniref:RING-type domain-containing protein n=1 Tax=Paratrimastix pyriformis TaxID=342808 RepID=A0ABQ8UL80_9EUKA|nr:hypothetical protein PAPYR_7007 [Paratrimastix pyriformis]
MFSRRQEEPKERYTFESLVDEAQMFPDALPENPDKMWTGVKNYIRTQADQLAQFETWARTKRWSHFHHNHYDWWMYPIPFPSSYRYRYTVMRAERDQLMADPAFMANFRRGCELLCLSWGWDTSTNAPVPNPGPDQEWQHWDVRLRKMGQALLWLKQMDLWHSAQMMFDYLRLEQRVSFYTEETVRHRWPFLMRTRKEAKEALDQAHGQPAGTPTSSPAEAAADTPAPQPPPAAVQEAPVVSPPTATASPTTTEEVPTPPPAINEPDSNSQAPPGKTCWPGDDGFGRLEFCQRGSHSPEDSFANPKGAPSPSSRWMEDTPPLWDDLLCEEPPEALMCVICSGILKSPVCLPCSHAFCKDCITTWIQKKASCPTCRRNVVSGFIPVISFPLKSLTMLQRARCPKCKKEMPLGLYLKVSRNAYLPGLLLNLSDLAHHAAAQHGVQINTIDLAANRLSTLRQVARLKEALPALENVNLSQNMIRSLDELVSLQPLSLREVILTDNPICTQPEYRRRTLALLPSLQWLDGQAVPQPLPLPPGPTPARQHPAPAPGSHPAPAAGHAFAPAPAAPVPGEPHRRLATSASPQRTAPAARHPPPSSPHVSPHPPARLPSPTAPAASLHPPAPAAAAAARRVAAASPLPDPFVGAKSRHNPPPCRLHPCLHPHPTASTTTAPSAGRSLVDDLPPPVFGLPFTANLIFGQSVDSLVGPMARLMPPGPSPVPSPSRFTIPSPAATFSPGVAATSPLPTSPGRGRLANVFFHANVGPSGPLGWEAQPEVLANRKFTRARK